MLIPALYSVKLINATPREVLGHLAMHTHLGDYAKVRELEADCEQRYCRLGVNGVGGNVYEYEIMVEGIICDLLHVHGDQRVLYRSHHSVAILDSLFAASALVYFNGGEPQVHYIAAIAALGDLLRLLNSKKWFDGYTEE